MGGSSPPLLPLRPERCSRVGGSPVLFLWRVRVAVEALDTHGIGPVTLSAGVAGFENDYDFGSTLKTADRRLYQAKASGRNCVV